MLKVDRRQWLVNANSALKRKFGEANETTFIRFGSDECRKNYCLTDGLEPFTVLYGFGESYEIVR